MTVALENKKTKLKSILRQFDGLVIAFSGGVDSTYLLAAACEVLQSDVTAVTAVSPIHPESETLRARSLAKAMGVRHILHETGEMALDAFRANTKDRCYICKKHLFENIFNLARTLGIRHVAHGLTVDDTADFRPGIRAAAELGVVAPLLEAGLKKADIRILSREMRLPTWSLPAAPCLATRIPYGTEVTHARLAQIAAAEAILSDLGFEGSRVRHHNTVARIEIQVGDFGKMLDPEVRTVIVDGFAGVGYAYVALDLAGYRMGSMNSRPDDDNAG